MRAVSNSCEFLFLFLAIIFQASLFLASHVVVAETRHLSKDKVTAIEQLLRESLFKSGTISGPALSLSVVTKDGVLYEDGKGFKDLGLTEAEGGPSNKSSQERNQFKADKNTEFGIASVTKGFTATLAVKLLSERFPELGESVLDTPIRKLIPHYNFILSDKYRTEFTTFRDLLAHRTCLKSDMISQFTDAYDGFHDFVVRQRFSIEKCGMRSEFVYHNGMYSLIGDLLGHLGNASYIQLMQDLFGQLQMNNTTFVKADDNLDDLHNRAKPYREKDGKILPFNPELLKIVVPGAPAGGIISSAVDMGKYMQFHLNEGTIGGTIIIKRDAMKWLVKPTIFVDRASYKMKSSNILDFDFAYALGFAIGVYDGFQRLFHAGSLPPYESFLSLYPDLDLGIFTVTSGPSNLAFGTGQSQLHAKIVDIVQGISRPSNATLTFLNKQNEKTVDEGNKVEENVKSNHTNITDAMNLTTLVGHYGSLVSGDLEITLKNKTKNSEESLWLSYGRWGKGWLTHANNNSCNDMPLYKVQIVSDLNQIQEANSGIPEIMIEFQPMGNTLVLFFKGQKDQGTTFKKGFNSKDLISRIKNAVPWDTKKC